MGLARRTRIAPRPSWLWFTLLVFASAAILVYQALPLLFEKNRSIERSGKYATVWRGKHWPGWADIEHVFIFGDSWTSTGFDVALEQPSRENPFGNPTFPGSTAANGANWVGYLTGTHNLSFVETVNFAFGGATVDLDLIHPDVIARCSIKDQVQTLYMGNYSDSPDFFPWKENSTLFGIFIGVNDIHNAHEDSPFDVVFDEFAEFIDDLYYSGARNFLFLNVPPIERSPFAVQEGAVEQYGIWVDEWNKNVTNLIVDFMDLHADATTFLFDNFKLYNEIIDNPCPDGKGKCLFDDVTTYCPQYAFGTPEPDEHRPECEFSVDRYMWLNPLHPVYPMHEIMSREIAKAMT